MRTSKLFPLLSGLVISLASACGDDGSSDTDTTDTTPDASDDSDNTETDDSDSDESSSSDTTTNQSTDDTDSDTDDSTSESDDTDLVDAGNGGDATDVSAEVDGGASDDSDGGTVDVSDDGGTEGDGGGADDDGGGGGDAAADAEPQLPEGACAESPVDPDNGSYADCDGTLNGGTCQLTCDDDNFIGGIATCTGAQWVEATCIELGSLTAEIGNAATGADLADAIVYIEGFYDPASDDCEANVYCDVTGSNGVVEFEGFPSGDQKVVIVKDGFDEIALPVNISPGDDRSIHLDALPTGFLANNIVVLLSWERGTDLDLVIHANGSSDAGDAGAGECVYFVEGRKGTLSSEPFAQLDYDNKAANAKGPETIRVALDNNGDLLHAEGYSVTVGAHASRFLNAALPSVRVIRAGDNGSADVELFTLPEGVVAEGTDWHVLDLDSDGSTAIGTTESNQEDAASSTIPCVGEVYFPEN